LNDEFLPFHDFFEYLSFILCARFYLNHVDNFDEENSVYTQEMQRVYDLVGPHAFLHDSRLFWELIDEGQDLDDEIVHYLIQELHDTKVIQCQINWMMDNFEERVANSGAAEDTMLNTTEICSFLNVSKPTLYKHMRNGLITCAYKIGRDWKFKLSDLWADLERMQEAANQQIEEQKQDEGKWIA